MVNTPLQVGQVESGFPTTKWVSLTDTQIAAYGTAPTAAYNEVFKPYDWGYFTLGASRGLAFHWWFPLAASLIALYALFLLLGASIPGLITAAVIGTLTPYAGCGCRLCPLRWWRQQRVARVSRLCVSGKATTVVGPFFGRRGLLRGSNLLCDLPALVSVGWLGDGRRHLGQAIDNRAQGPTFYSNGRNLWGGGPSCCRPMGAREQSGASGYR